MNKKQKITLILVLIAITIYVTGLAILISQSTGNPTSNSNSSTGSTNSGISIDQAVTDAQNYLQTMGYSNLAVGTVQRYSNMYYAQILEKNNGTGAFELSISKNTGAVTPMQGPTLLWDTKYGVAQNGMMGYLKGSSSGSGMMGGNGTMTWLRGTPTTNMAITMEQAKTFAQAYLDATNNGTSVGQTTVYYGFYTMQVLKDGNPVGMMAIYGTTGTATYYSWLGTFMQQKTVG